MQIAHTLTAILGFAQAVRIFLRAKFYAPLVADVGARTEPPLSSHAFLELGYSS